MADKIEPLVELNIANVFKQLHDTALKQAKPPKGFVIKNLAFADEKTIKMKAGDYLITIAPEDEKDNTLFLDDKTRPDAEKALSEYVKFFVNKKIDPKEFAEITVDVQDNGSDNNKKNANKNKKATKSTDDANKKPEKPAGESLRIKATRNSLLTNLFDDYSLDMINEEGESKDDDNKKETSKNDEKTPVDKTDGKDNGKDSAPKATTKVRGLSIKYTCELAGEKKTGLMKALKKNAKGLLGGIWNDLTQIKITGGVFGKDGLAVGKVINPDAWKETIGRPDIDANTIKSDIDTIMSKDYPNTTAAVSIYKCSSMLSLLNKAKVKISGELKKVLSETELCIGIKIQKTDENYGSFNEESIAEVLNKSIGNYYKSILTHPAKFKISKDNVFKVENYSNDNKEIGAPKDKQEPNKTKKESMSFLAYCKLQDLIVEDSKETKDDIVKKVNDKVFNQIRKNIKPESLADGYIPKQDDILYGTLKEVIDKVKWLKPENSQDISKIDSTAGKHTHAFVIDLPVVNNNESSSADEEKDKDTGSEEKSGDDTSTGEPTKDTTEPEVKGDSIDVRAKYSKLLNILFESTLDEAENGLSQTLLDDVSTAVKETLTQLAKKVEIPSDYQPIVFNYYSDNSKKQSNESRLFNFIYKGKLLGESTLIVEKADPFVLKCFDEIDRVGYENISKGIDDFRKAWQDNILKAKSKLPDELAKRSENSEGYLNYLKKKYVKGADGTPFDKNIISKLRKATSTIQVKNLFASYGSNSNETEFNKDPSPDKSSDTIPEYYAAWQALKTLPSQKKITITFWTADKDNKKKDEIDSITIVPGKSIDDISDGDNKDTISSFKDLVENDPPDGMRFDGYEPSLDTKLFEDTDIIAKYAKKDAPIEIEFYDVDPENPDDESKWKDIDIQEFNPEKPDDLKFPKDTDLEQHKGWKFEKWEPTEEELKKDPPKTTTKVKATYSKSSITISLYDTDPETGEREAEPISTYEIEKGTAPNASDEGIKAISDANKKIEDKIKDDKSIEFKGWNPEPSEKVEEDTVLVAKYSKEDVTHEVKFVAPPESDPSDIGNPVDIGEPQTVKDGESAEAPEPPDYSKQGYEFVGWDSEDWKSVKDDLVVLANYDKQITITFKVPKDPKDPESEKEQVGDPVPYKEGEPIKAPKPPDKDGFEFDKWDPNPDDFKPEESTEIIGTYKEKEEDEKHPEGKTDDGKILHEVYVFIDIADLAKPKDAIMIDLYAPKKPNDTDEKGPIDVGNGKYKKIDSIPVEKGKDFKDELKGKEPDFTKDGYEFKDWVPGKVKDGKQPKTLDELVNAGGGPAVATYKKKEDDGEKNASDGHDLYIYASKKIKYKNEKSVGRKDKKMMNGNAYST